MGCDWGAAVRPANDRVASKRGSPARSLANAEASVVPPRMRTRMSDAASCPAARWLSIVGIGEDGIAGLSPVAQKLLASAELVVGGKRHLGLAEALIRGRTLAWPSPIGDAVPEIEK